MKWFTSDLHLGHANIIDYCNRPFANVDEMNRALIDNWNDRVGPKDTVWVLGDFAMGHLKDNLPLARELKGFKILLPGNHDRVWRGHPDKRRWLDQTYVDAGFYRIEHGDMGKVVLEIGDWEVLACHFPYWDVARHETRFSGNLPEDEGLPLLHGHTHSPVKVEGNMFNVCVDARDYAPVSEDVLFDELNTWAGHDGLV